MLAELGMEPAAIGESGVRVIATAPEFYGSRGETFPSVGGSFFEQSLEDLVTTEPDLVIGLNGVHEKLREGLEDVAPIFLSNPQDYKESIVFLETWVSSQVQCQKRKQQRKSFWVSWNKPRKKLPRTIKH